MRLMLIPFLLRFWKLWQIWFILVHLDIFSVQIWTKPCALPDAHPKAIADLFRLFHLDIFSVQIWIRQFSSPDAPSQSECRFASYRFIRTLFLFRSESSKQFSSPDEPRQNYFGKRRGLHGTGRLSSGRISASASCLESREARRQAASYRVI